VDWVEKEVVDWEEKEVVGWVEKVVVGWVEKVVVGWVEKVVVGWVEKEVVDWEEKVVAAADSMAKQYMLLPHTQHLYLRKEPLQSQSYIMEVIRSFAAGR